MASDTRVVLLRYQGEELSCFSCPLHCHVVVFQREKPVSPLGFSTLFPVTNSMLFLGCFTCLDIILKAQTDQSDYIPEDELCAPAIQRSAKTDVSFVR